MNPLLSSLPPLPARMRDLPVDARGYPVPFFVAWLDPQGKGVPRGEGTPDFRVIDPYYLAKAVRQNLCWICGQKRTAVSAFLIGPMCAVNRISSEPPSHIACAEFAAHACPFLATPARRRREKNMPEGWVEPAGVMVKRNPGVTLLWAAPSFRLVQDGQGGVLFELSDPDFVRWFCEGRTATRAEVEASIELGLPVLEAQAEAAGESELLRRFVERAELLLPAG